MSDVKTRTRITDLREMMKSCSTAAEGMVSDQTAGLPQPPLEKPGSSDRIIPLTMDFENVVKNDSFLRLLNARVSRRKYSNRVLTLDELTFLLWATQGVKTITGGLNRATRRTVPSAGARHPLETYLLVYRVSGLAEGIYHYLAQKHKLEFLGPVENPSDRITEACCGQTFPGTAAVDFIWTVTPYRTEWRYVAEAHKYALLDAGHVCQNLYLACEAIGCGTCAVGAYDQKSMDRLLGLDSRPSCENQNEFAVYAAPVGKLD
ncbi:MAG TPA: SagB/ThcOx family dehydrogenase [Clostridia bacterium]